MSDRGKTSAGAPSLDGVLAREVVETSPVGITVIGADGSIQFVNERAEEIYGRSRASLEAVDHDDPRWDLVDEDGTPLESAPFTRIVEDDDPVDGQVLGIRRPSGERIWVSVSGSPQHDETGALERVVFTFEEVTEQRRLQAELDDIYGRIAAGFYALDEDWRFTHANDRARELIDVDNTGLVGEHAWEIFEWAADSRIREEYETAMETQEPTSFEVYYPEPLSAWYEIHAYPSETGLSVFFRDVSERKWAEREIADTTRTLQQLYEISADPDRSFDEKMTAILELGRELLGVETGYLAAVDPDDDRLEIMHASSDNSWAKQGATVALSDTYCSTVVDKGELLAFTDSPTERGIDETVYGKWDQECYIGGPVVVDGDLYGTLCFENTDSRAKPFSASERTFVELVTQWVRYELERRKRREALTRYTDYTGDILDGIEDAFYVLEGDGSLTRWNESFREATGYDESELESMHALEFFAESEHERIADAIATCLETGSVQLEAEVLTKDGTFIPYEILASTLDDPDAQQVIAGIGRDITDRRDRNREFERALDLLNKTERIASVAGWEIDLDTMEPYWSDHLFDLVAGDYDGQPTLDEALDVYETAADRERVEEAVDTAIETGEPFDIEARFNRPDGDGGWLRVQGDPEVVDGDVISLRGAVQDITERKRRERRLEESNERLEQFAYAASHDLQEPLRMVSSYLQLLERRYAEEFDGEAREFIEFAVDGADRMREMIDGLLAYSRVEAHGDAFEPVDLNTIVDEVVDDLQFQIDESGAAIDIESLPTVDGDPNQLRQVFQNLLDNAIEYSGAGHPEVQISATRRGEMWTVSVSDAGIGIDPAEGDRVFEVFERFHTREEHEGTGIGLALCKRIVERHDGEIWLESEPGAGTTFSFTLPASDESNSENYEP